MRARLAVLCALVLAVGCSKATPADHADAATGDDTPDGPPVSDIDAPGHVDAVPDSAITTPDANTTPDAPAAPITLTLSQTTAQNIVVGSVSCNAGGVNAENSYYRAFTLAEHGVVGPFTVTTVGFGVESADGDLLTTQPATIRLLRYTGAVGTTLNLAQTTVLATSAISINNAASPITLSFPIAATVPANSTFLFELLIPDGDPDGDGFGPSFFIGSNAGGETKPGYLRAPDCSTPNPTTIASLGFATMNVVMTVTGSYTP